VKLNYPDVDASVEPLSRKRTASLNLPAARTATDDRIDVLQATRMRKPQGSATEFNRQIGADLGDPTLSPRRRRRSDRAV
jgi:hypothetical protein